MFPQIDLETAEVLEQEKSKQGRVTFLVDFKKKIFLKENGRLIKTDDNRSVRMFVEKIMLTKVHCCKAYKDIVYGFSFYDLISGHRFPTGFLYAELNREIFEMITIDERIESLSDFNAKLVGKELHISFTVNLKNHQKFIWEGEVYG